MYNELQKICKTPTRRSIQENVKDSKKVILVSATPLNNKPDDIANLVYLFQNSKDSTLPIGNLQHFFRIHIDTYKKLKAEKDMNVIRSGVKSIYGQIRIKVIEPLMVRRTRTDLLENEAYGKDLKEQGIMFPHVNKPEKIFYKLDPELDALYDKTIFYLSSKEKGLTYNRYRAIGNLKPHKKNKYQSADLISTQLATIMKTLLVKRIDSSFFFAFKQSLRRFYEATIAMVKMFEKGAIYIAPNLDVTTYINENKEDELIKLISQQVLTDPTIEICAPDDFEPRFYFWLRTMIKSYLKNWLTNGRILNRIQRLRLLLSISITRYLIKRINPEQKLIIFSESKETTDYVQTALEKKGFTKMLCVDSKSRKEKMPIVNANFDAQYTFSRTKERVGNILISTKVLEEGKNLHRANIIVNYEIHPWNSTRLMQRIGRVNRIGTKHSEIHIFNFFPTSKVDDDIELQKKAKMKLAAFHAALGEDSQMKMLVIDPAPKQLQTAGAPDLSKGLSPAAANQTVFFLRSIVRFGLPAAPVSAGVSTAPSVLAFLLASINRASFSGNPLFFAALLLALVNDFAARGVRIVKPYFFLYSFCPMPWETRCFDVSCFISAPHSRQITLSFWMEPCGVSTGFCSGTGSMPVPASG